jgi:hypothetical protein
MVCRVTTLTCGRRATLRLVGGKTLPIEFRSGQDAQVSRRKNVVTVLWPNRSGIVSIECAGKTTTLEATPRGQLATEEEH